MNIITVLTIPVIIILLALCQIYRNFRYQEMADSRTHASPVALIAVAVSVIADILAGREYLLLVPVDLIAGIICLWIYNSILCDMDGKHLLMRVVTGFAMVCSLCHLLFLTGMVPYPDNEFLTISLAAVISLLTGVVIYMIYYRICSVRRVMKSGTVWFSLCMCVDMLYILAVLLETVIYVSVSNLLGTYSGIHSDLFVLLLTATVSALAVRLLMDSVFILYHRHERRIVESLKVSQIEVMGDNSRNDYQYKEVYERVLQYFDREKPYLNGELTINDLVKVLYSNKLYISKAISHYTGRNFCQFVNYYRVTYSIERFRANPDLKVLELSLQSGFNSVVSFNMAFRLFMGESPSEWCRKERNKLLKNK